MCATSINKFNEAHIQVKLIVNILIKMARELSTEVTQVLDRAFRSVEFKSTSLSTKTVDDVPEEVSAELLAGMQPLVENSWSDPFPGIDVPRTVLLPTMRANMQDIDKDVGIESLEETLKACQEQLADEWMELA